MSFEIRKETSAGLFHIKLECDVPISRMIELCQLAENIVGINGKSDDFIGPTQQDRSLVGEIDRWSKDALVLGAKPVDSVILGDYREPDDGVRIKMLFLSKQNKIPAIRAFREITNMSLRASAAVVEGNVLCPRLSKVMADKILVKFEDMNVYGKLIECNDRANENTAWVD